MVAQKSGKKKQPPFPFSHLIEKIEVLTY